MYVYKPSYQKMDKEMNAYVRPADPLHLYQLLMSQNGVLVEITLVSQSSLLTTYIKRKYKISTFFI